VKAAPIEAPCLAFQQGATILTVAPNGTCFFLYLHQNYPVLRRSEERQLLNQAASALESLAQQRGLRRLTMLTADCYYCSYCLLGIYAY
jgi:hypothetical protein